MNQQWGAHSGVDLIEGCAELDLLKLSFLEPTSILRILINWVTAQIAANTDEAHKHCDNS